MKTILGLMMSISLAAASLLALVPLASAHCTVNAGTCDTGGSCDVNLGTCDNDGDCEFNSGWCDGGDCTVNHGSGFWTYCSGECTVNTGTCSDQGRCTINLGYCNSAAPIQL